MQVLNWACIFALETIKIALNCSQSSYNRLQLRVLLALLRNEIDEFLRMSILPAIPFLFEDSIWDKTAENNGKEEMDEKSAIGANSKIEIEKAV